MSPATRYCSTTSARGDRPGRSRGQNGHSSLSMARTFETLSSPYRWDGFRRVVKDKGMSPSDLAISHQTTANQAMSNRASPLHGRRRIVIGWAPRTYVRVTPRSLGSGAVAVHGILQICASTRDVIWSRRCVCTWVDNVGPSGRTRLPFQMSSSCLSHLSFVCAVGRVCASACGRPRDEYASKYGRKILERLGC